MRPATQINHLKVQTTVLPPDLTTLEVNETARGIALFYKNNNFTCQTFFTPPAIGEITEIEGLEDKADVYFRTIELIGPNLFHVRTVGKEDKVRKMCDDPKLFNLIRGISSTLTEDIRMRRYLETTKGWDVWDVIVSLDRKAYYVANYVNLDKKRTRINNIIVVGDRLLGLTDDQKLVIGQITPDIIEKKDLLLDVSYMEEVNKIGKVDLLEPLPNTENSFLVSIKNHIYQFNIWGEMVHFDSLEDGINRINSISFNRTRSIMATDKGLYEVDVQEMPNFVRPVSLPRQIAHPNLRNNFKVALYVEDPYLLGVHPAMGVFAKTEDERILFF